MCTAVEIAAARVSGLMAPQSPEERQWETLWGYMQSGPGVFKGDLYFYFQRAESDFLNYMARIDTRICPVYLLAGEYDYSCTPEDTQRTGAYIPGSEVMIMKEMGHFPCRRIPLVFGVISSRCLRRSAAENNGLRRDRFISRIWIKRNSKKGGIHERV